MSVLMQYQPLSRQSDIPPNPYDRSQNAQEHHASRIARLPIFGVERDRSVRNAVILWKHNGRAKDAAVWPSIVNSVALSGRYGAALAQTSIPLQARRLVSVGDKQHFQWKYKDFASLTGAYLSKFFPRVAAPFLHSSRFKAVVPLTGATVLPLNTHSLCPFPQAAVPLTGTFSFLCPPPPPESEPYTTGQTQ